LRQVLIAGEVALTVVLLAAAGLIVRTLVHLETLPPGFNPNGVIAAKASLDDARYHDQKTFLQLLDESTAAMRKIPGVRNAAVGLSLPYERVLNDGVTIHGGPDDGHQVGTDVVYVTPGYFEILEIPLAAGRGFLPSDGPNDTPVAVINSTFARKFFPGINPIGRTLDKGVLIVGVAADVPISSGLNPIAPLMSEETMYIPAAQLDPRSLALVHTWFQPSWIVRSASPVEGLTEQMQKALTSVAPGLPFSGFYSMRDVQATTLSKQRVETALLSTMALLALLLSAVGIFALVSSIVSQKTREIGIRIALGSSIRRAMFHVGSSGLMASLLGMLLGLALAAGVLRVMRSVLYGVDIYDAPSLIAILAVLVLVTLGATVLPTMRVGRIEPAKTLREE
jgi:predicted permease